MSKKEFLDILRQSLEGEVDNSVIEKNIRYYSDYISSDGSRSEEEIIDEIGDPRLIAKTIIESERMSGRSYSNDRYESGNFSNNSYYDEYTEGKNYKDSYNRGYFPKFKWFYKIAFLIILFFLLSLVFSFLLKIGFIFLKLISVLSLPVFLIILLIILFRRR